MQGRGFAFLLTLLLSLPLHADDVPLVVVSNRQFLVQGDSTIHLYLYGLDGKLRKQLTNESGQDDHAPLFSHDGKSILFSRVTTGAGAPNQSGKYILQLADNSITKLADGAATDTALKDYAPTVKTIEYGDLTFSDSSPGDADPADGTNAFSYTSPDKTAKLINIEVNDDTSILKLKTSESSKPVLVSSFSGYEKSSDDEIVDWFLTGPEGPFLLGPGHYSALFVNRHRDSMWVLDVHRKVWHKIQSEWVPGDIYCPQNKAGFYFVRCSMEPLGDTGKTVMSAYLEWWDAQFHHAILGAPLDVNYGSATYYGPNDTSSFSDENRGS
jgi:hypothetical protein